MTKEEIARRFDLLVENQERKTRFKYSKEMIVNDLFKRVNFAAKNCATEIHDNYLRQIALKLNIQLMTLTKAELAQMQSKIQKGNPKTKAHKEEASIIVEQFLKDFNRFVFYPVMLKREGYECCNSAT